MSQRKKETGVLGVVTETATKKEAISINGYQPVEKGWVPKVQGGFKPTGVVSAPTPSGGSAIKPPTSPQNAQNPKR